MKVNFRNAANGEFIEIYADGKFVDSRRINYSEDGQPFIYMPNLFRPNGSIVERFSFTHRPGDMVQAIHEGWGDAIEVSNLIVRTEHLIHFVERNYGERMREKSLEGWKDTEFAWVVIQTGGFGDEPVNISGDTAPLRYMGDARNFPIQYYSTEAEAQAFIDSVVNELEPKMQKYRSCKTVEEKNAYYEAHLKAYQGIKEYIILYCAEEERKIPLCVGQVVRWKNVPYTAVPIWGTKTGPEFDYFLCPGEALDKDSCKLVPDGIVEGTICLQVSVDELFANRGWTTIYRVRTAECATDWFLSLQEAFDSEKYQTVLAAAGEDADVSVEIATLNRQILFPIVPTETNPIGMFLEEGEKGLFARENLNPDQVGKNSNRKKVYFPDKSCAGKLGAGKVRVTKVIDRGNYGFIVGEMIKWEMPSEQKLAEFLLDNHKEKTILTFIRNPYWGSAVKITDWSGLDDYYVKDADDRVSLLNVIEICDHKKDEVVETIDAYDFLCQGYAGKSIAELCSLVTPVAAPYGARVIKSPRFVSENFDTAVDIGVIEFNRFNHTDFCVINPDKMCEAASVLQETLIDVLKKANEINLQAVIKNF